MKKAFTQLSKTKIKEVDSELSDSESEDESQHFQYDEGGFQFTQIDKEFKPRIAELFKQTHGTKVKLDLREIILLDSQSTMDMMCNRALVEKTFKSSKTMRLKSNGGTMEVTHKAKIAGYHTDVWYNKKAITKHTCIEQRD